MSLSLGGVASDGPDGPMIIAEQESGNFMFIQPNCLRHRRCSARGYVCQPSLPLSENASIVKFDATRHDKPKLINRFFDRLDVYLPPSRTQISISFNQEFPSIDMRNRGFSSGPGLSSLGNRQYPHNPYQRKTPAISLLVFWTYTFP